MKLLRNIGLLAVCGPEGPQEELHAIPDAALAWEAGTIRWAGPEASLPPHLRSADAEDAGGRHVFILPLD